jgi:hypothetical protein
MWRTLVSASAFVALMTLNGCTPGSPVGKSKSPTLIVHKSATCGCCKEWVKHMERAGFAVETRDVDNLGPIKERVGIPPAMGSCHTAEVGGYFVEGHVPASDVERLLAQRPKARGLTVPGMPIGSPGMEVPSGESQAYDVYLVADDGTTSVFAHHEGGGPAPKP